MVFVVERREDARRQVGRTAPIDQLEQPVQVDPVRPRQPRREVGRESGAEQPPSAPPDPLRSIVGSPAADAHVWLAAPSCYFLRERTRWMERWELFDSPVEARTSYDQAVLA
jgi:hypothetical protein